MKIWMMSLVTVCCLLASVGHAEDLSQYSTFKLGEKLKARARGLKENRKNLLTNTEPNPLYRQIFEAIQSSHTAIGEQLTGHLLRLNDGFDLGNQNFNGINWQKPFGNFAIGVNRQLSPDLFDDQRWIVDDTFSIFINASTYLSNLRESGDIQITEKDLAAYAGITFKRTYRYVHFAPNFRSALVSDYGKLFMSFWKMRNSDIFDLSEYEIISRTDQMSLKGGALISSPNFGGFNVNGGVIASYSKLSKVQVQAVGPMDIPVNDEYLRISVEKEEGVQLTGQVKLQVDFYKLLKLTLLSYDVEYSYSESDKKYLSMTRAQVSEVRNSTSQFAELIDLLRLKKINLIDLKKYVTQEEVREKENFSSKYSALIWGGEAQRGSQSVVISKNGMEKTFVTHHARSVRFTERLTSKLAGIIFAAIFKSDNLLVQYLESISREIVLEFESNRQAIDQNDQERMREVADPSKLSLRIIKEYKSRSQYKKSSDWKKSNVRERAVAFLQKFTNIDNSTLSSVSSGSLKSPLVVQTVIRIEKEAIAHFNNLSREAVFGIIHDLCYTSETEASKQEYCYNMIEGKYKAYIIPFLASGKIHVVRLKDFLYSFNNQFDDLKYFYQLFGRDLVFTSGSLEATRSNGQLFLTYFHQGEFRGLGVMDNFVRESGMITPAPIFNY